MDPITLAVLSQKHKENQQLLNKTRFSWDEMNFIIKTREPVGSKHVCMRNGNGYT